MTYQMIAFDEPLPPKNLLTVIFGEPGTGKTSLSFTTEKPVLMDYDKGLERAINRKTAVKFTTWEESIEFMDSDDFQKGGFQTLVADTGGTMLDNFVSKYVVKQDPKNARGGGDLSLQGYGAMKNVFDQFKSRTETLGVDIVIVCHTKTTDDRVHIPKMTGGSYDILLAAADLVGYTTMKGKKITIDFNPTSDHTGKNCAQFPIMDVPYYTDEKYSTFLGDIIQKTKDFMTRQSEAQVKAIEEVQQIKNKIFSIKGVDALEKFKPEVTELSAMYRAQVKQTWDDHFVKLWPVKYLKKVKVPEDFEMVTELLHDMPKYNSAKIRPLVKEHMEKCGVMYDAVDKIFVLDPDAVKVKDKPEEVDGKENGSEATVEPNKATKSKGKGKAKPKNNSDTVTSEKGEKVAGRSQMNT